MKRQSKLGLLAVAFTTLLMGLVLPSLAAAVVTVGVGAVQKEDSSIVVTVVAISSTNVNQATLDSWKLPTLTVDGALNVETVTEYSSVKLRSKVWVVRIDLDHLLEDGDIVSATVDLNGPMAGGYKSDDAYCKLAPSWLGDIHATCK